MLGEAQEESANKHTVVAQSHLLIDSMGLFPPNVFVFGQTVCAGLMAHC